MCKVFLLFPLHFQFEEKKKLFNLFFPSFQNHLCNSSAVEAIVIQKGKLARMPETI